MKVRKKPVVVDAWHVSDILDGNLSEEDKTILAPIIKLGGVVYVDHANQCISINTLEGVMSGPKDWILIRGVKGEFYPCAPDVYEESYESA